MNTITADSFLYRPKLQPSKKSNRKRLAVTAKSKLEVAPTQLYEQVEPKIPITYTLDLLQAYRVYVDRKLTDYKYFEQLSMALGATVVQDPKDGISILVHGPKDSKGRLSKLVHNALENHVHVVSPVWLRECYASSTFHDPYLYPCDYKEKSKLIKPANNPDDNPFGLGLDVLETTQITTQHNIPQQQKEEEEVTAPQSPEPEIRGIEPTPKQTNAERKRSPRASITDNVKVKELLIRKRKEQEEREKSEGKIKKTRKDGTLTSFFGSSKMSIRYGESASKNYQ
ncbi:hypothetical protein K501DRAFT_282064 [Backusella circina FSU 941]|nr:hypothetical protein K501DRAFT_282064 [Backusella circina FSU 941]